jgi:hypothetical protein
MKILLTRLSLMLALLCAPLASFAALEGNTAITYVANDGTRRIHDFAIQNGTLVENYFDGSTWQWKTHTKPSDDYAGLFSPAAITYEENGTQRIFVFAITGNGHRFVVRYFNGSTWNWGKLPTDTFLRREKIAALTYFDEQGTRQIRLFAVDDATQARMVTTWWNGSAWNTTSFKPPLYGRVDGPIAAVSYSEKGVPRVHVYCNVNEFDQPWQPRLYSLSWQRGTWQWVSQGVQFFAPRSAITYVDGAVGRRIQLFGTRMLTGTLALYDRNGSSWDLLDLGNPEANGIGPTDVAAITYLPTAAYRQIYVATILDDHLYFKSHDGNSWSSFASFTGGNAQFADDPTWIHYLDPRSGNDVLQMFVSSAEGLMRHRRSGTSWQSYNQGAP